MLKSLTIKNIALIDYAEIDFSKGLNILSGETGAGKSVILESFNFVLGAKADKTIIRNGENECKVVAEFDVTENNSIKSLCEENGLEFDDTLIVSRTLNVEGKSTIRLNGEVVTSSIIKKFTSILVDVHGQSEHFSLLKNSNQLKLIDRFGGVEIEEAKNKVSSIYSQFKDNQSELLSLGGDEKERLNRLDILNYQIKEIEDVSLKENEEEELTELKKKLNNEENIMQSLNGVKEALCGENGVNDILSNVIKSCSNISNLGEEYSEIFDRINSIFAESEDIGSVASNLIDDFGESEYNIDSVEERLYLIKNIKKKYGENLEQVNKFLENSKIEREKLENFNDIYADLLAKNDRLKNGLYNESLILSNLRRKYSDELSKRVKAELITLGMVNAEVGVEFSPNKPIEECEFSSNGFDEINFLFSANLGEPLKNLSSIISGGEMSRFMLAIKCQTAKYNDISTFIFDEIDAGISGVVASIVAKKLADISKNVQVIAITHLPQIASMGDNNLLIEKVEELSKTITKVSKLDYDSKVSEIVRLIGGEKNNESAVNLAKELISNGENYKNN